jgi:hypothetical protein
MPASTTAKCAPGNERVPARPTLTVAELLALYPVNVAALANDLRPVIQRALPDAEEVAYTGWQAIGYRDPRAGYVCGIFLFEDHVRLIFERGHLLPDPDGVLEGKTKQTRHLTLRPEASLPVKRISHFVALAADLGARFKASAKA